MGVLITIPAMLAALWFTMMIFFGMVTATPNISYNFSGYEPNGMTYDIRTYRPPGVCDYPATKGLGSVNGGYIPDYKILCLMPVQYTGLTLEQAKMHRNLCDDHVAETTDGFCSITQN
jgi:hypothetical protein